MPHVVVLTSGGTISSRSSGGSVVAVDDASTLLAGVEVDAGITVEAHEVVRIGSYRMTLADLRAIADAVAEHLGRDDVDGVVVTHGTDTLEETAILLDLTHDDDRPVVLTGAQRAADVADTDGPRNLGDAIAVAASAEREVRASSSSSTDRCFAARGVRKSHTVDLDGVHQSGRHGRHGALRGGAHPQRPGPAAGAARRAVRRSTRCRVDIVARYPGGDDALLRAAVRAGARGIVLVGTGLGNAPAGIAAAVAEEVADGVVDRPVDPRRRRSRSCRSTATGAVTTWWQAGAVAGGPAATAGPDRPGADALDSGRTPAEIAAALGRPRLKSVVAETIRRERTRWPRKYSSHSASTSTQSVAGSAPTGVRIPPETSPAASSPVRSACRA